MIPDFERLIQDFIKIMQISGNEYSRDFFKIEELPAPHVPPTKIPEGNVAVYTFFWEDQCLKVGKVGPNSNARYTSQHYNPKSSISNLSKSILSNGLDFGMPQLREDNVGKWIKENIDRVNVILDMQEDWSFILNFFEAYLQLRLKPKFEGG